MSLDKWIFLKAKHVKSKYRWELRNELRDVADWNNQMQTVEKSDHKRGSKLIVKWRTNKIIYSLSTITVNYDGKTEN